MEMVSRLIKQRPAGFHRAFDYVAQIDIFQAQRELARRDAGDIQQVVDQPCELRALPVDDGAASRDFIRIGMIRFQHLGGDANWRQGIAQFMRQRGDKNVLAAVCRFQHGFAREQLFMALAQQLFVVDALGHVRVGAEPALDAATLGAHSDCPGQEPAVLAVVAAQRKGVFPWQFGL